MRRSIAIRLFSCWGLILLMQAIAHREANGQDVSSGCVGNGPTCALAPASCGIDAGCAGACDCCYPSSRWFSADLLLWWMRGMDLPPLVTTSPAGTAIDEAGVLGLGDTQTLFGGNRVNDDMRAGIRVDGGTWLDPCQQSGIGAHFLCLESEDVTFRQSSAGDPILARPFIDANVGNRTSELVAFPGFVGGTIDVNATSDGLCGWGVYGRRNMCMAVCCDSSRRLDFVAGYRYLRLRDRLTITEQLTSPLFVDGTVLSLRDEFATRNAFHGAEFGVIHQESWRCWLLQSTAKVGLGANQARVRIDGRTITTSPGLPTVTNPGGLYALTSNIGNHENNEFTALMELGLQLGYRYTERLTFRVGYTFLFWPDVFRAGDQIDPVVNPNLLPPVNQPVVGPLRPGVRLNDSDFWAQGINLGAELQF